MTGQFFYIDHSKSVQRPHNKVGYVKDCQILDKLLEYYQQRKENRMGQANLRGTFEQRKAEGIAKRLGEEKRKAENIRLAKAERAEREANMTPEQRARAIKTRSVFAALMAMVAASEVQKADFANAMRNFNAG